MVRRLYSLILVLAAAISALPGCLDDSNVVTQALRQVTTQHGIAPGSVASPAASATTPPASRSGSVASGSANASPVPPTPSPPPASPPTPIPTAKPMVAVSKVVLTTSLPVVLYLPASNPALDLGLATSLQLSAYGLRADGSRGGVTWLDQSGGQLTVSPGGLVSTTASTKAGTYQVLAQSTDDPGISLTVTVYVQSTGQFNVSVQ